MRREQAIALATLLILGAFVLVYWKDGFKVPEVALPRREVSLPPRRSGPHSTLLSTAPIFPTVANGKFRSEAFPVPLAGNSPRALPVAYSPYPADSVCDIMWNLSRVGDEKESDEVLLGVMDSGRQNDDQTLFRALVGGDWSEIEGLDRYSDSPSAREISLLGRLGQFIRTDTPKEKNASVDPVDLNRIDEMASADPENAYWPMLKYSILRSQGASAEDLASTFEVASTAHDYRNPVSSFYEDLKLKSLESPQKFAAYSLLSAKAPTLDPSIEQFLKSDAGKGTAQDEVIARIRSLIQKSKGSEEVEAPDFEQLLDPNSCDEAGFEKAYNSVLNRG